MHISRAWRIFNRQRRNRIQTVEQKMRIDLRFQRPQFRIPRLNRGLARDLAGPQQIVHRHGEQYTSSPTDTRYGVTALIAAFTSKAHPACAQDPNPGGQHHRSELLDHQLRRMRRA